MDYIESLEGNNLMKKQRWKWTKNTVICPICKNRIHHTDQYYRRYGFCSVSCGYDYYGLY
jgi:hypothetical protein